MSDRRWSRFHQTRPIDMARDPHLRGRPFPLIRIFGRTVRPERLFLVGFAVLATVLGASLAWGLVTSRSDLPGACGGGLALGSPACLSWNTEPADIAGYEIRVALGARDEQRFTAPPGERYFLFPEGLLSNEPVSADACERNRVTVTVTTIPGPASQRAPTEILEHEYSISCEPAGEGLSRQALTRLR